MFCSVWPQLSLPVDPFRDLGTSNYSSNIFFFGSATSVLYHRALSRKGEGMSHEWILSTYSRLQDPNFLSVPNQTTFMDVLLRGKDAVL